MQSVFVQPLAAVTIALYCPPVIAFITLVGTTSPSGVSQEKLVLLVSEVALSAIFGTRQVRVESLGMLKSGTTKSAKISTVVSVEHPFSAFETVSW